MRQLTAILALLILLMGAGAVEVARAAPDDAWNGVTVLLDDGWRYRDVSAYLDAKGAGLWVLRADGAERLVDPGRVVQIVDAHGDDVTRLVLSGRPGPASPTSPAGTGEPRTVVAPPPAAAGTAPAPAPAATRSRLLGYAFTIEGSYGSPQGDWFDDRTASWGAGARLRVGTFGRSYLGLGARFQDFDGVAVEGATAPSSAMVYEFTFGWLAQPSRTNVMTYLEMGAALLQKRLERPWGEPEHDSSGAFLMRGGVMLPINRTIALDLSASAALRSMIFKSDDESSAALLGVHVGLTWRN